MWSSRKKLGLLIGLIGIISLVALACSSADEDAPAPSAAPAPAAQQPAQAAPVAGVAPAAPQQPLPAAPAAPALPAVPGVAPGVQALPGTGIAAAPVRVAPMAPSGLDVKYGGTLRFGRAPNVEQIFTLTYSGGACASWCMEVGDPITAYGPDSEWVKEKSMAESFSVSPDQRTITFTLKEGLLFSDGTVVDADAIKFSLDFVLDGKNGAVTRSAIETIDRVDVIDAQTFSIHTKAVFAPIISNLGMSAGMPFSPTAFAVQGIEGFENSGAPTTGPFMITEWVTGSHTAYERNPLYHREGRPFLDGFRWVEIPEDQVKVAAMRTKELDIVTIASSSTDAIKSLRDSSSIVEFKGFAGPRMDHFNAARAPFDDIRVRQAAQMAMDRAAWNQAVNAGEGHLYRGSLLPPGHAASFEVAEEDFPYAYDPDAARALLEDYAADKGISLPLSTLGAFTCSAEQAAAGCADLPEQPITITASSSPANIQRAEISQAFYNAVGFDVTMDLGSGDEAKRTFVTKEASFSLRGFGLRPHPSGTFNSYLGKGGYWNNGGWGLSDAQERIDVAVRAASAEFNTDRQNAFYREAQQIYMENALGGVRIVNNPSFWYAQPWVKWDGFPDPKFLKFNSDNTMHIHDVWLDR